MKIKNTTAVTALTFAMMMSALPLTANGSKDTDSPSPEQDNSVLKIVDRPFGFGEGGGMGAGLRPEGFEEIDESIIAGNENKVPTVAAEMITMNGTLTVKGTKGKRKFTFKTDEGKNYILQIPNESAEEFAKLKKKHISIQGVFYDSDFLVFDVKTYEAN